MIKIVTDSSSDISPSLCAELGVSVVPVRITFGGKTYYDGVDIDRTTFYQHLGKSSVLPTLAPPSVEELQETYGRLLKVTDQILSIHSSSRLNKTALVAQQASKLFLGRTKITVVDSRMISWGLETVVSAAASAAKKGASSDEIVRLLRGLIPHIYMVFFAENSDYLERQSHPGRGRMFSDNLPGARPLLIVEDGEIVSMEKVRTRGKSLDRLFEFVAEFAHFEQAAILQGRASEDTQLLFQRLTEAFPKRRLDVRPYGPALATYLGPDALGVAVYEGI
jgi:DegV family protein with EDD domain